MKLPHQSDEDSLLISGSESPSRHIPPPPPGRSVSGAAVGKTQSKSNLAPILAFIGLILILLIGAVGYFVVSRYDSGMEQAEQVPATADALSSQLAAPSQSQVSPTSTETMQKSTETEVLSGSDMRYYYVTGLDPNGDNWLALKELPNLESARLDKLPGGTLLKVTGSKVGRWVPVETTSGRQGWVSGEFLACCQRLGDPPDMLQKSAVIKPSFDCNKASSISEKLICADPELARMDLELAGLYRKAKSLASDRNEFTRRSTGRWKDRESQCFDKSCLVDWYVSRKQELQNDIDSNQSSQF
ncbi:SH3 domain-containing protein [Arenimonas sp.]|jgi:hypothetical protein|uniref:SH3 domain-containing protein n=1 Tax=Arenimonas sp. TaxID=1872635 RepID=UPI0037BFCA45